MPKSFENVQQAFRLYDEGCNVSEISRELGVSRMAIRSWFAQPLDTFATRGEHDSHERDSCSLIRETHRPEYAYLLGQYLGDGCLSAIGPRGVFRLRIATCDAYPAIRARCIEAVSAVMPSNKVSVIPVDRLQRGGFPFEALAVSVPAARTRSKARAQDRPHGLAVPHHRHVPA